MHKNNSSRLTEDLHAMLKQRDSMVSPRVGTEYFFNEQEVEQDMDELELFEDIIAEAAQRVEVPLLTLRQQNEKDDPQEELIEVFQEASDYEDKLVRLLEVASLMLEKNRELIANSKNLQAAIEQKEQTYQNERNAKKRIQDQLREKVEHLIIEKDRARELEQSNEMLAADLERAKERRQLLEDQLQQRHYMNVQTKQVNSSVDYESDKKAQSKIKEELAKLRQELASERSKKQELEELVEKNLLLYEHECEKTTTLQKEWQKEKASAMHYKKRYTRNKETNEKQKKLIRELENSVKELHTKVQGLEVAKEAVITKEVKRKALVNLSISKQSNSILNTTLDQLDQDKKSNLNDSMQSGQWITLKNRASLVSLQQRMTLKAHKVLHKRQQTAMQPQLKKTLKESEPLNLVFPFPITRKVSNENIHRQVKSQRRASIEIISPLQPDLIKTMIAAKVNDDKDTELVNSKLTFMMGRNGAPTTYYTAPGMFSDSAFERKSKNQDFDLAAFALFVHQIRSMKRSTSVSYKTVYADEDNKQSQVVKSMAVHKQNKVQLQNDSDLVQNFDTRSQNSFLQLDANTSSYNLLRRRNDNETSRIEGLDTSRIDGDILPGMFQEEEENNFQVQHENSLQELSTYEHPGFVNRDQDDEYQEVQVHDSIDIQNEPRGYLGHFFKSGTAADGKTRSAFLIDSISSNNMNTLLQSGRDSEFFKMTRKKPTFIASVVSQGEFIKQMGEGQNEYFEVPDTFTPIVPTTSEVESFTPSENKSSASPGLKPENIFRPETMALLAGKIGNPKPFKPVKEQKVLQLVNSTISDAWLNRRMSDVPDDEMMNQGLVESVIDNDFQLSCIPAQQEDNFVVEMVDDVQLPATKQNVTDEMVDDVQLPATKQNVTDEMVADTELPATKQNITVEVVNDTELPVIKENVMVEVPAMNPPRIQQRISSQISNRDSRNIDSKTLYYTAEHDMPFVAQAHGNIPLNDADPNISVLDVSLNESIAEIKTSKNKLANSMQVKPPQKQLNLSNSARIDTTTLFTPIIEVDSVDIPSVKKNKESFYKKHFIKTADKAEKAEKVSNEVSATKDAFKTAEKVEKPFDVKNPEITTSPDYSKLPAKPSPTKFNLRFEDDSQMEFGNGAGKQRSEHSPKKPEPTTDRQSMVTDSQSIRGALGDEQANKLTEAYEDLERSMLQEMDEEFDSALDKFDQQRVNKSLDKPMPKLPPNSKLLKSVPNKRSLRIQVIEELEDEESLNPYGNMITPNADAGNDFSFPSSKNGLQNNLSKMVGQMHTSSSPTSLLETQQFIFESEGKETRQQRIMQAQSPQNNRSPDLVDLNPLPRKSMQEKLHAIEEEIIEQEPLRKPAKVQFSFGLESQTSLSTAQKQHQSIVMRKDPHEEFFKLTLLAFKLNNKMSNSVLTIDPTTVYNECMKKKIAFYRWPQWIEDYMKKVMYQDRHKGDVARALRVMDAKNEQDTVLGDEISIKLTHFGKR